VTGRGVGLFTDFSCHSHHLQVEKINMEQRSKIEELEHDLQHSEVSLQGRLLYTTLVT
jgi:hypothetical protein